ncbi:MAG: hypothetical protein EBR30_02080 [Cytophagia bacterium]|nr:hypothetical protein [Cytophagia bacterium]
MRTSLLFCFFIFLLTLNAHAQTEVVVSDEELLKYATAMDSVNELTVQLTDSITLLVKNTTVMSAARYNELSRIANDEAKLTEAKATTEEISFIKYMADYKSKRTNNINQTFQNLAKTYVGAATFNKVKKALTTNTELKAKYDTLMEELKKDNVKTVE